MMDRTVKQGWHMHSLIFIVAAKLVVNGLLCQSTAYTTHAEMGASEKVELRNSESVKLQNRRPKLLVTEVQARKPMWSYMP